MAGVPRLLQPRIVSLEKLVQVRRRDPVFSPGIVCRFNFNGTQSNDRGSRHDSDIVPSYRSHQPFTEILLRLGDGESRHMNYIEIIKGLSQLANRRK